MKNINETVKSKYLIYILFLAGGLLLGWLLFHNSDTDSHTSQASETGTVVHDPTHGHDLQQNEAGEWTCIPKFAKTSRVNALSAPWI